MAAPSRHSLSTPTRIPMILPGRALESLRDSGYSLPTALAEVVDNALEARANMIRIEMIEAEDDGRSKSVSRIITVDDGDGMDADTLHHYMQIGFSTRWMRRDTIGKYGVGAKLAALNFGRRIDVWSRQTEKDPWLHVYFDLDEALADEKESGTPAVGIDAPTSTDIPNEFAHLCPQKSGTIVVWDRIDRLEHGRVMPTFNELVVEVQKELARIFREFINAGIRHVINGTELLAHDPLFLMTNTWADHTLTKEQAHQAGKEKKKPELGHFQATLISRVGGDPIVVKGGEARIRVTLYPPEVTRKRGLGGDNLAKKLRVPENDGCISFMRMNREVAYTNVPKIFPRGVEPPDRFIGIEVAFTPELDEYFGIRNVKRGVEPHGDLRDKIRKYLQEKIKTARDLLEEAWGRAAQNSLENDGEHSPILDAVKAAEKLMPKSRAPKGSAEDLQQELEDLAKDAGHANTEEDKWAYYEQVKDLPFLLESVDFPGKMFIDIKHVGGKVIIRVNTRHRFYREFWEPLQEIARRSPGSISNDEAIRTARRAAESIPLMVIAYGKAQSMSETPADYDDLTTYWGQFIDTLMGKVKDVF